MTSTNLPGNIVQKIQSNWCLCMTNKSQFYELTVSVQELSRTWIFFGITVFLSGSAKPHSLTLRRSDSVSGAVVHGSTWQRSLQLTACIKWRNSNVNLSSNKHSTTGKSTVHILSSQSKYNIHQEAHHATPKAYAAQLHLSINSKHTITENIVTYHHVLPHHSLKHAHRKTYSRALDAPPDHIINNINTWLLRESSPPSPVCFLQTTTTALGNALNIQMLDLPS